MMKREYPATRAEEVVDEIHGVKVPDSYRWLENTKSDEVQNWIEAQNKLADDVLGEYEGKHVLENRLREFFDYDLIIPGSLKIRKTTSGFRFFYLLRKSGRQQPSLFYQDDHDGDRIELVNPLDLSSEGLVALDWFHPSRDGSLVAYGLSEKGTEWSVLHVIRTKTREILPERIQRTRNCSLVWLPDNSGFYYTRFPLLGSVPLEEENYNRHVFFHELGENYEHDVKVFGDEIDRRDYPVLSSDEKCTIMAVDCFRFTSDDIYITSVDTNNPTKLQFHEIIASQDALSEVYLTGKTAFVLTQLDAPNARLLSYDLSKLAEGEAVGEPKVIIRESDAIISPVPYSSKFCVYGDKLAVVKEQNASSRLEILDSESGKIHEVVNFKQPVTINNIYSHIDGDRFYFDIQSFLLPPSIHYYASEEERGIFYSPEKRFDPMAFDTHQVWYESKDGTRVPMFLIHKRGLDIDSNTPVCLTGYGGFGISLTPGYGIPCIPWIESDGIFAIPNLRGGMEFGQQWHRGGNRENKQNVFDDFISAAEWLIENHIGSKDTLAIRGASNGGLLVGAALTQRPDLFKAVSCAVPLLDMIRYTQFDYAQMWAPEYGDPEIEEEFRWLFDYSPYHHVSPNRRYPATLFMTAMGDSRVDPMHALKMTALLQQDTKSNVNENPVILQVLRETGHGASPPVEKVIETARDYLLFLAHYTGLDLAQLEQKEE